MAREYSRNGTDIRMGLTCRALAVSLALFADAARAQTLANGHLRVEFGPRGITAITDLADARTHRFRGDNFAVTINAQPYESRTLAPHRPLARLATASCIATAPAPSPSTSRMS